MSKTKNFFFILVFATGTILSAQDNPHEIKLSLGSSVGFGDGIPFWLFSNQYSLLDIKPFNAYASTGYKKSFSSDRNLDFAGGINLVNRYSDQYAIYPEEVYGILRFHFLDLQVGRKREVFGNHDKYLSSGGLLWSGNALPVPKISLSTPGFVNLPFTHDYIQVKLGIAHGWLGDHELVDRTFLHHKYFFARTAGDLPVSFSVGLHHYAQWGGIIADPRYGKQPTGLREYIRVFFAGGGGSDAPIYEQLNAAGRHIGSYNLRGDLKLAPVNIGIYWQSIFEDGSGMKLRNLWDGLYGISIELDEPGIVSSFLFEVLSTMNQSGAPDHPDAPGSSQRNDNYFNHGIYKTGWSYRDLNIGNPLITSPVLANEINIHHYFFNNRVNALHAGIAGLLLMAEYRLLYSYSMNHGTYRLPFDSMKRQSYFLMDLFFRNIFKQTIDLGFSFAFDNGKLLGNNFGFHINLVKKLLL